MATNENLVNPQQIREAVKKDYTRVVERSSGCCGSGPTQPEETARRIGYSDEELQSAPEGSNLGVGCGNPTAIASLRPGEAVLDLGSGAGFDAFLAARAVGPAGFTRESLESAEVNLHLGARFLRDMLGRFGPELPLVLSAYNAGPTRANRWKNFAQADDPIRFTERIPFNETRGYVKNVTRNVALYRALYGDAAATPVTQ